MQRLFFCDLGVNVSTVVEFTEQFQSHRFGPVMLVLGLVGGFAIAGSLLGIASSWLTGFANLLRDLAVGLLFGLGVLSIFPSLSYRMLSRWQFGKSWQPNVPGLWSEFWIGTQLGLLWTPCAGPILAAVLVQVIRQESELGSLFVVLAFATGAAIPMLIIALTGRRIMARLGFLARHAEIVRGLEALRAAGPGRDAR